MSSPAYFAYYNSFMANCVPEDTTLCPSNNQSAIALCQEKAIAGFSQYTNTPITENLWIAGVFGSMDGSKARQNRWFECQDNQKTPESIPVANSATTTNHKDNIAAYAPYAYALAGLVIFGLGVTFTPALAEAFTLLRGARSLSLLASFA